MSKCRTAELGGHIDKCDSCGNLRVSYNSCRNRNCPKCQGVEKEMWVIQQEDTLLPVAYFHVVFTLPHELNGLCLLHPDFMYDLLLKSAWHTINTLAKDKKWMGAHTAATMVLHTWSQTLVLHPHAHCIVPNGGLTQNGKWQFPKRGNGNFLFPVIAMQKIFKGYFMQMLGKEIQNLHLPTDFPTSYNYRKWKDGLYQKNWVVYTKKPFSGASHVIQYLARYAHRIAITNHRIISMNDTHVTFSYKDYKDGAKTKTMTIEGIEFVRRFALHVLPLRFRKVRHYGFLSNASRKKSIAIARNALKVKHTELLTRAQRKAEAIKRLFGVSANDCCPKCKQGTLKVIEIIVSNKDPPVVSIDPTLTNIKYC